MTAHTSPSRASYGSSTMCTFGNLNKTVPKSCNTTYIYADCDDNDEVEYDRHKVPGRESCRRHPAFCLQDLLLCLTLLTITVTLLAHDNSLFLLMAIVIGHCTCSRRWLPYATLKTESCHDAESVLTGGTVACRNDNLWCRQWRESWHYNNPRFQWNPNTD